MRLAIIFILLFQVIAFSKPIETEIPDSMINNYRKERHNINIPLLSEKGSLERSITILSFGSGNKRYSYKYDSSGNRTESFYETGGNNSWNPEGRVSYIYDMNGNNIILKYERFANGTFYNVDSTNYGYDDSGNQISYLHFSWENKNWQYSSRGYSFYNVFNHLAFKNNLIWYNDDWVDFDRDSLFYSPEGNLTEHSSDSWNITKSKWVNSYKYFYTYDSVSNLIQRKEAYVEDYILKFTSKETFIYDKSGNVLTKTYETYESGKWNYTVKTEFLYDVHNNCIQTDHFQMINNSWILQNRWSYYFNNNGKLFETIIEVVKDSILTNYAKYNDEYDSEGRIIRLLAYKWSNGQWEVDDGTLKFIDSKNWEYTFNSYEITFEYYDQTDVFDEISVEKLNIQPNPASEYIEIGFPDHTLKGVVEDHSVVGIFNILGERVLSDTAPNPLLIEGGLRLDVSGLPPGVYFVRVGEKVSKFLKILE